MLVNCRRLPFATTLGVASVLLQLARSLVEHEGHDLVFVLPDREAALASPAGPTLSDVARSLMTPAELRRDRSLRREAIELLPHHFTPQADAERAVVICHDLHVFDIPWKYGESVRTLQRTFRSVMEGSDAVVAHFPRTYFDLERVADVNIPALFLTPSPLMLDTSRVTPPQRGSGTTTLLFPAQLQVHKNHEALARGLAIARATGADIEILCPGSDGNTTISDEIRATVEEVGLGPAFRFLGRVSTPRLVELYQSVDGLVVPSAAEGGAYVPLEGIAAGLPVAVNAIRSATMHIDSFGADVITFDAEDIDSVAEALIALHEADPLEWWERNRAARTAIAASSWSSVASRWTEVLEFVAGDRPQPRVLMDADGSALAYA